MAYTELIKFLGSLLRWAVNGFKGKFVDYYDEKLERENFTFGIILIILIVLIIIPIIGNLVA